MSFKSIAMLLMSMATWSTYVVAQENLIGVCERILESGLKESSIESGSDEFLGYVYERTCDSSSKGKTKKIDSSAELIIKAVPAKFLGNYSSTEEAARNFCKNYESYTASKSFTFKRTEKIITRAYDSLDDCVRMVGQGVTLVHRVRSVEKVDFFLAPGFSRTVILKGIDTSDNISCSGQDPAKSQGGSLTINQNSRIVIQGNQTLSISCTRTPQESQSGEKFFLEGTVTLFTDVGRNGNYGMYWPDDIKTPLYKASEIASQIASLTRDKDELAKKLELVGKGTTPGQITKARGSPEKAEWSNEGGPNWLTCPPGHYVAAVGGYDTDGGGYCSTCISRVGIQCLPLKGDIP